MFSCIAVLYFVLFFTASLYTLVAGVIIALYFILLLIGSVIEIYLSLKKEGNDLIIIKLTKEEENLIKTCKLNNISLMDVIPIGASVLLEMDKKELSIDNTGIVIYDMEDIEFANELHIALEQIQNKLDLDIKSS